MLLEFMYAGDFFHPVCLLYITISMQMTQNDIKTAVTKLNLFIVDIKIKDKLS